ncbi:hypothetical protein FOMPIDRAFT_1047857 [Fomitopsis schrenkii]|uniref:F-box domain-containing protein n=1 Tax=Fomitopsis schrenkii TaxID=2126942 RepID=S8EC01_FOMSC|nr:hypothetical protein FOMPIDRAFT_1047857 [Fomitopsis schrenkii]
MNSPALPLPLTDHLPSELMEQILGEAKCDNQILLTCLPVCTAWHSFLISSLYESIHLHSRPQLSKLARAACIYPAVRARLASARAITFCGGRRDDLKDLDRTFAYRTFPLVLGPHLPSVQHLSFLCCRLRSLHPTYFARLPQLANVRSLSLDTCHLKSFSEFQRLVCAFPLLEELHLKGSVIYGQRPRDLQSPLLPGRHSVLRAPRLTLIRMNELRMELVHALVVWLTMTSTTALSSLRALDISWHWQHIEQGMDSNLVNLILPCSSKVERVRMTCGGPGYLAAGTRQLTALCLRRLGQLAHLRTLDIMVAFSEPTSEKFTEVLRDTLSALANPTLEAVRLELQLLSGRDTHLQEANSDHTRFHDLHAVLTRTAFDRLARVAVIMNSRRQVPKRSALRDVVAGNLRLLRALFAPWLARGAVKLLVSEVRNSGKYAGVVAKSGEDPFWIGGDAGMRTRERLLADWDVTATQLYEYLPACDKHKHDTDWPRERPSVNSEPMGPKQS